MKRRISKAASLLLCFLLLAGCTANPQKAPEVSSASSVGTAANASDKAESEQATDGEQVDNAELAALQSKIKNAGCTVGIALVDIVTGELSEADTVTYLQHSETIQQYPFLSDVQTVLHDGIELFLLVPASAQGVITVHPAEITDAGELEVRRDETIYKGAPGEAIALRCNVHEGYANVLVSVTDGSEVCELHPMVSLEDGCSVAPQEGCYDFSVDNIHKYIDGAYNMLPKTYPEIKEVMDNGGDLIYAGDFYFCNQIMMRFELGKYTVDNEGYSADGFVCEKQYAVSFDATYAMDPADHSWYVIGAGVKGMGLQK